MRITKKDLRKRAEYLATLLGTDYEIESHSGGHRLVCNGGSKNVSDRGSAREVWTFMSGMEHIAHTRRVC